MHSLKRNSQEDTIFLVFSSLLCGTVIQGELSSTLYILWVIHYLCIVRSCWLHRAVTQCWWEYKLYKKWAYWITWLIPQTLHCSERPIILSKQLLLVLLCDQKYMVTMTTISMLYHIATAYQIQVPRRPQQVTAWKWKTLYNTP